MKKIAILTVVLATLLTGVASGTPVLTLIPASGDITAPPGGVAGWGFHITNDTNFVAIAGSNFLEIAPVGIYADLIGPQLLVLGPGQSVDQTFNGLGAGLGEYLIDPGAVVGAVSLGTLEVLYDVYSRSPNDPLFDPFIDTIAVGQVLQSPASVTVVVPEPSSLTLMAGGLVLLQLCTVFTRLSATRISKFPRG